MRLFKGISRGKTPVLILVSLLFFGMITVLLAQAPAPKKEQPADTKKEEKKEKLKPGEYKKAPTISIADYNPITITDPRFIVHNVNFERRYAPSGLGEFLDVVFNVQNLTDEPIHFYTFVIAFDETNSVDSRYRRVVPYPTWRPDDPAKDRFLVNNMTVTPKDIPTVKIWDENDKDFRYYRHVVERMRQSVATKVPVPMVFPPLWKYLSYFTLFPTQGLDIKLYGSLGPVEADIFESNYKRPPRDINQVKIYKDIKNHKYSLEFARQRTIVRSHHYSKFRSNYKFFNRVSIILYEKTLADKYEKDLEPLLKTRTDLSKKRDALEKKREAASYRGDYPGLKLIRKEEIPLINEEDALRAKMGGLKNPMVFKQNFTVDRNVKAY